ncbi:putative ABC transport system permease protein [Clostridium sp. DSM 8431]|uniref:ABC transporter permease n=1 Tax=Clostridium sp. DSM 8431 TaxID=1761781 RepID=UPI0008E09233|nr:FtsX-like permease family protein [Clostridium sp. DSM 8431]SFU55020.1 putative ABC transport system permease protein [Clostridium sp. DSM 8431]
MIVYYLKNIFKSLSFNSFRTFLTGLGILIGISSLVIIFTISDSFSYGMNTKVNGNSISIGLVNSVTVSDNTNSILEMPKVKQALQNISKDMQSVKSFTKDDGQELLKYIYNSQEENSVEYEFDNDVIINEGEDFKSRVGNVVIVRNSDEFDNKIKIGKFITVNGINYEVIGYTSQDFSGGMPILYFPEDKETVIKPSSYEESSTFELVCNENYNNKEVAKEVVDRLNKVVPEGYKFVNISEEINKSVEEAVNSISIFIIIIAGISIIVAGINVANIMYISILERTNEVAIYRALGMKKREVQLLFLLESMLIVFIFSIIGYIIGVFISYIIVTILRINLVFKVENIIKIVLLSMIIGIIAGVRPAKKASNINTAVILK